ncbi:MAG: branched-chain amino acid ABC transporter substrate-binding protein [Candidatus Planktophila sp.]
MRKNKVVALATAVAFAAGTVVAMAPSASAATTLKIAYQGPLTGPEAQTGTDGIRGVKLALKEYRKTKPKVKVVLFKGGDDQGEDAQGLTVGAGIAADPAVVGVLTAYSGPTISALPSYKAAGITIISPSATRASLTDSTSDGFGGPVFHRIVSNDDLQGPALVRVAIKGVNDPSVFVVDDQSSYSAGLRDVVLPALGTILAGKDSAAKGITDFSATIAKIKKAKANVVIYTGYYADGAKFLKQLRDKGYKGVYAAGDGVLNSAFPKLAGLKAAEGTRMTAPTVPLEVANPKAAAAYKKMFKAAPGVYSTEAYDATRMFLQVISAGATTRAEILAAVNKMKFVNSAGVTISFQANGDLKGSGLMNQFAVKNGKIVLTGKA